MSLINAKRVEEILIDCLIKDSDHINCKRLPKNKVVVVKGIVNNYGFHKERLESYREEVRSLLNNLSPDIKEGISFLNICMDKENNQWGEHPDCENLVCLAIGLEIIRYVLPKEAWFLLPGNVPIIALN